jgi:hypothetical protein
VDADVPQRPALDWLTTAADEGSRPDRPAANAANDFLKTGVSAGL